ncbi:MAG: hypothetical protein A3G81_04125 [Betaproteobacteria bacterium RIFCSPLOWO2_12_FULL_65_14]|nr:MAG: hypothetical protein A3G81_04125 [Betaproteobacteria bacterium RIFCSPLOWO2_12_FULL_65_14]
MKEWNVGLMRRLGMRFVEVAADRVVVELADTAGAAGTAALGFRTATLESKTNFFPAATGCYRLPSRHK